MFYTGLRIAEAAKHSMGHFLQREQNWFLRVTGKGKKIREIPMPDELLATLSSFRLSIQLSSPLPTFREEIPLIPMQNLNQPNYRKKGIGTALIKKCEQIVKEHGFIQIGLGVGMTSDYGNA